MSHKQRIHLLQHVSFEGPAAIATWVNDKGGSLSVTKLHQDESLPAQNDFDWLIIMGGPMGVDDTEQYPWLTHERRFILETIRSGKCVLGICLGAQLIAAALGATIKKNKYREIGWFNIKKSQQAAQTLLNGLWPENMDVFHWHGDTFDLPNDAQLIASSEACANQGFIFENRVIGLQFHLEVTPHSVASLVEHCHHELDGSEYVQTTDTLLTNEHAFIQVNNLLYRVLEKLEKRH